MTINDTLYGIYEKGVDNRKQVTKDYSRKRNLLTTFYYLALILLSPKTKNKNFKDILLVNSDNRRKVQILVKPEMIVYRGFTDFDSLRHKASFLSFNDRWERIHILFQALHTRRKYAIPKLERAAWLEFLFMAGMFEHVHFDMLYNRGHYDDISTWLSLLCEKDGKQYIVHQHGIVSEKVQIKHKIFCSEFNGFDEFSLEIFRTYYIKNQDCRYKVFPFPPSVDFIDVPREPGRMLVGIAEQYNPEWVKAIADGLKDNDRIDIVIMLHPLSQESYTLPNCSTEKRKIGNVDIVLTDSSTLIIDYYRYNPAIKGYYSSDLVKETFRDYPFVYCEDTASIVHHIKEDFDDMAKGNN